MSLPTPGNIAREIQIHAQSKTLLDSEQHFYRIWQSQASPYSMKVMSYMNFKGIPYKKVKANFEEIEWIKKVVGQSIVPVVLSPDEEVLQDSTPIMEMLESQFTERTCIPDDRRLEFLMWLIEEFSDEYMTRLIMHARWGNEQNRSAGSHRIARTITFANSEIDTKALAPTIRKRQAGFDQHLGLQDSENIRNNLDQQISDLLQILEQHFKYFQFLLGFRPSMADFALYGFLINMYEDPTFRAIIESLSPKTCNWLETISNFGDTRGNVGQTAFGDWLNLGDGIPDSLEQLLVFIARTYIPLAQANVDAAKNNQKSFEASVYGVEATFSLHQYRLWSLEQLQLRFENLSDDLKNDVDNLLLRTGVQPALMKQGISHCGLFDGFTPPVIKDGASDARLKYLKDKKEKSAKAG